MSTISADFTVQTPRSSYLKLTSGLHHIRILGPSVSGWEYWEETAEGGRKPIRFPLSSPVPVEHADDVKKFLAWPVWNYDESRIQIFEATQTSIQRELIALERNAKWGDLKTFDIEIERQGNDMVSTKYFVRPEPKSDYSDEITKAVAENGLPNLNALFVGGDPFNFDPELSLTEQGEEQLEKDLPF